MICKVADNFKISIPQEICDEVGLKIFANYKATTENGAKIIIQGLNNKATKSLTPCVVCSWLGQGNIFKIPTVWAWLYNIDFLDEYRISVNAQENQIIMRCVKPKRRTHKAFWCSFRGRYLYIPALLRNLVGIKILSGVKFDFKYDLINILPDSSNNPKYHVIKNGFIKIPDELIKKYDLNSAVGATFYDNRIIIKNLKRSECIEFFQAQRPKANKIQKSKSIC